MRLEDFKADLKKAGKICPLLLIKKLQDLDLSDKELAIMRLRYVEGLLIKQIPEKVSLGERRVKKIHARALNKTLDGLKVADLLELGIHLEVTPRSLYAQ